ncbi:3'-5' exonuclease [Sporolactobacillus vineae]|uniref:3'-5' exonuclease n=1 Tax=Sporolactobacillus vineae TaxID=444463 RepID=UPI00047517A2|nr:3'-5' exonuclease [Sporolactobacillus vineae]
MLDLDQALRDFRDNPTRYTTDKPVKIKFLHGTDIFSQAQAIANLIKSIRVDDPDATFAILFNQATATTSALLTDLTRQTKLMDATFKTEDPQFKLFQQSVLELYQSTFATRPIHKNEIQTFCKRVEQSIPKYRFNSSFIELLKAFLTTSIKKFPTSMRSEYIVSTLSSESLHQSLPDVSSRIVATTIHGAKGLEWDYVILANFQQEEFPNYYDLLSLGISSDETHIQVTDANARALSSIINKLYVGFSRAKKQIYFAYSDKGLKPWGEFDTSISVLTSLPFFSIS